MRKKILVAAALIMSVALTGCSIEYEGESVTDENATQESVNAVNITFCYTDEKYTEYLEYCKTEFEKDNENTNVNLKLLPSEDYINTVISEKPDAYMINNSDLTTAYLAGIAEKVSDSEYFSSAEYCTTALNACSYNGSLIAYPVGIKTTFLVYNHSYVDDDRNFTFDKIKEFSENNDFFETEEAATIEKIFSCNLTDLFYNYGFVGDGMEIGGDYGNDQTVFSVNNEKTAEAAIEYINLIDYFSIDRTVSYNENVEKFLSGKTIFTIMSTDSLKTLDEAELDYTIEEFPDFGESVKAAPLSMTSAVAVNPFSNESELARNFAAYVSDAKAGKLYEYSGVISANEVVTGSDKNHMGVYDSYKKSQPKNKIRYGEQVYPLIEIALHNILQGVDDLEGKIDTEDAELVRSNEMEIIQKEFQSIDDYMKLQFE